MEIKKENGGRGGELFNANIYWILLGYQKNITDKINKCWYTVFKISKLFSQHVIRI